MADLKIRIEAEYDSMMKMEPLVVSAPVVFTRFRDEIGE